MADAALSLVLDHLRRLARAPADGEADADLLNRFAAGDEAAFVALVQRHGPLVWGVCRRCLPNAHDAEDAFQATFLVLARRAGSVRRRESLPAWLHGVARHVALNARREQNRRQAREKEAVVMMNTTNDGDADTRALLPVLDEALAGLPAKYRQPLLLCYLQGQTHAEAARALKCPAGSVSRLLAKGRELLRARLEKLGYAVPAGALAVLLAEGLARGALPAALVVPTARAALAFAAGKAFGYSGAAVALAEATLKSLLAGKAKVGVALLLTLGLLAGGAGAFGGRGQTEKEPAGEQKEPEKHAENSAVPLKQEAKPLTDRYGDPLPDGVLARMGTVRFRLGNLVYGIAVSPDGNTIISTGGFPFAKLWDRRSGKELQRFETPLAGATAVAFSPNGKMVAFYQIRGVLELWRVDNHQLLSQVVPQHMINSLAFSPDGKTLASAGWGRPVGGWAVQLWNVTPEKLVPAWSIAAKEGPAHERVGDRSLAFAPDGKTLALGSFLDGTIRIRDAAKGDEIRQFKAYKKGVTALAYSPDGTLLACGGDERDPALSLWDPRTGERVRRLREFRGGVEALAFSPDGKYLAAGGGRNDPTLRIWDVSTHKEVRELGGGRDHVAALAFTPDSKTLVGGCGGAARLWDVASWEEIEPAVGHQHYITSAALAPDGRTLATASGDGTVRLWDRATGKETLRIKGHEGDVRSVAFAPGGRFLASCGNDQTVRLWDATTGKEVRRMLGHTNHVYALAYSPDGRLLASGGYQDGLIILWDPASGKEVRRFRNANGLMTLAFSPDSKTLATGETVMNGLRMNGLRGEKNPQAEVKIWEVATGKLLPVPGHDGWVHTVAFSPDGKYLATGGRDKHLRVVDAATGGTVFEWEGNKFGTDAACFSPDGRTLAVAGDSAGSVTLLEFASRRERGRFTGHQGPVTALAYTPDGRVLISGGLDTTALAWDVTGQANSTPTPSPPKIEALWAELAGEDAARAHRAIWSLADGGGEAVRLLAKRLRAALPPPPERLRRLIADLESEKFATREKATEELQNLGDLVEGELRTVLAGQLSPETRRRVESVLKKIDPVGSASRLQALRAVEVLEYVGTSEARQLLEKLTRGAPEARLTKEAKASLDRLGRRSSVGTKE